MTICVLIYIKSRFNNTLTYQKKKKKIQQYTELPKKKKSKDLKLKP